MRMNKELYNEFLNLLKKDNKVYVRECSVDKQKKKILFLFFIWKEKYREFIII